MCFSKSVGRSLLMMIFNVETHGDIRFCPICRRYIVTIANSPQPVARPFTTTTTTATTTQLKRGAIRAACHPSTSKSLRAATASGQMDLAFVGGEGEQTKVKRFEPRPFSTTTGRYDRSDL